MAHTELDLRERRAIKDMLTGYHGVTAQRMSGARRGEDGPDARSVRRMRLWSNHVAQCGHALPLHPVPLCLLLHERRGGPVDYMDFGKIPVCWSGQRVFRVPATGAALATCHCSDGGVERHRPACLGDPPTLHFTIR